MKNNKNRIVEYILVNKELDMGVGKIAGQVAHVQTKIDSVFTELLDDEWYSTEGYDPDRWLSEEGKKIKDWYESWLYYGGSQTKVILKAKEKDLLKAIELGAVSVRDNGLTEIPSGSLTAVGFMPQPKSNLVDFTKKFQLL